MTHPAAFRFESTVYFDRQSRARPRAAGGWGEIAARLLGFWTP